jgi:hypothetical protein
LAELTPTKDTGGVTGSAGLTVVDHVLVAPRSSVTVNVTEYVPPAAYACLTVDPEPTEPSPNAHAYDAIEPSESLEDVPSNEHTLLVQEAVADARGGVLGKVGAP